jgi:nucleotide-binding universal stress UspA family protein
MVMVFSSEPEQDTRCNSRLLVVVSDNQESEAALRFACLRAKKRRAQVSLLHVIEPSDLAGLFSVFEVAQHEQETNAQALLQQLTTLAESISGITPTPLLKEGHLGEEIVKATLENGEIVLVVLGVTHGSPQGQKLLAWLTGKIGQELLVPIILVPSNLTDEQIENLAN